MQLPDTMLRCGWDLRDSKRRFEGFGDKEHKRGVE